MTARHTALAAGCLVAVCAAIASTVQAKLPGRSAVPDGGGTVVALCVIPFPGTPDASPSSQVIFPALDRPELRSVVVIGSRSGTHLGRLEALPAGAGTAFVPDRRFAPGETVRVRAELASARAGTASGDPGATRLSFSFGVRVAPSAKAASSGSGRSSQSSGWLSRSAYGPTQHFHSAPGLRPPVVTSTSDPDRTSGDIFAGVLFGHQGGPMILNAKGQLVWFLPGREAADFAVQQYQRQPVLTWWQKIGSSPAEDVIMDRSYRTVAVVRGGDGLVPDAHEFQITPQGTAFLSTVVVEHADLTSVGGPRDGYVLDDVVQEVDIRTAQVLWEWHSLGHVPLSASYTPAPHTSFPLYDYFHLNSIQQLPNGNLLISARNTWAVYEINRRTGRVIWTLGGKYSDFAMGRGTRFEWQHDARLHGEMLSLFDDAAAPQEAFQSSAKLLRLNTQNGTVSLVHRFTHFPAVLTPEMGSVQTLPNGNVFVGWGSDPQFSEYTPTGQQIYNGVAPLGVTFYRIFRFPWVGHPRTRPALALSPGARGRVRVYVSWNGATQVVAWRVLGGPTKHDLAPLGVTVPENGFETTIEVPSDPRYFAVQALDRKGSVLSTSPARADPARSG